MIHIQFKSTTINNKKDLSLIDTEITGQNQFNKFFRVNIENTLKDSMDFIQPGVSQDGTIAMLIKIGAPFLANNENGEVEFGKDVFQTALKTFGSRKVISCTTRINIDENGEKNYIATLVILPVPVRKISATEYLDEHNGQPKNAVKAVFETALGNLYDDIYITGISHEVLTEKELGYQDALINYKPIKYDRSFDHADIYIVQDKTQTEIPLDKIKAISNGLIARFKTGVDSLVFEQAQHGQISKKSVRDKAEDWLKAEGYNPSNMTKNDHDVILKRFYSAMYGNYILDPLIEEDEISDIMCLGPDNIRVKAKGRRYTSDLKFMSAKDYLTFCEGIAIRNNLDVRHEDVHVFSDPYSSPDFYMRLNLTTSNVNTSGFPVFQIRKIAKHKRDWDYLIKAGMVDEVLMNYLIDRARTARGIILCGKGASGKTTMMNVLLDEIPFNKSVEVMQESIELFSNVHPHIDFKQITKKNPLDVLARNGLLTDLDYYIIGETKGKEAAYLGMAVDSGHRGWTTVHASSAREGIYRLADYIMQGTDYNQEQALKQLLNMDTLIYMQDFKVCEIYQIKGWDRDRKEIIFEPVYLRPGIKLLSAM